MSTPVIFRGDELTVDELRAIKAVAAGMAEPDDQRLALTTIAKKLAGLHELAYVPGSFDETAFLAGRQRVGRLIEKIVSQPLPKPGEDNHDGRDPAS